MRDRILYSICFGFVFGVLLRSFVLVDLYFAFLFGTISLALFFFFTFVSKHKWGIVTCTFLLAFSLGIFRFQMVAVSAPGILESQVGQKVSISGVILDEPSITENNQKLVVQVDGLEARILVSVDLDEEYRYGERITFSGKLNKPENFITDQGKQFDYVNYLRKDEIFFSMSYPQIEVISQGHGNPVKNALFLAKNEFLSGINLAIPRPESLLLGGLILGERSSFGQEMRQKFIDTGTIHIVALSGYNVTIVAEWIMKMFSFLPRNLGFGAGIVGILLFVIMAGGQATAVRAGTMAVLVLIARATGRTYDVARALVLAGVIMIVFNPFVLAHDVSFQLSFIATVAVIFFTPKIEKYFLWVTPHFKLRDVVSVTFAAYIFVLPFILYKMGNLSLVAFPANVLILPFIPITMVFGFLTGFAGVVSHFLAAPFGIISYLFLHYQLGVIDLFARLPFASFTIPNFPFFLVLMIYGYFIYKLFGPNIKNFFNMEAGVALEKPFAEF